MDDNEVGTRRMAFMADSLCRHLGIGMTALVAKKPLPATGNALPGKVAEPGE